MREALRPQMSSPVNPMRVMHSFSREDPTRGREGLTPGTTRRVAEFARPYSRQLLSFLVLVVVDAVLVVATPLLFKKIVDQGVLKDDRRLVTILAIIIAALAVGEAALTLLVTHVLAGVALASLPIVVGAQSTATQQPQPGQGFEFASPSR